MIKIIQNKEYPPLQNNPKLIKFTPTDEFLFYIGDYFRICDIYEAYNKFYSNKNEVVYVLLMNTDHYRTVIGDINDIKKYDSSSEIDTTGLNFSLKGSGMKIYFCENRDNANSYLIRTAGKDLLDSTTTITIDDIEITSTKDLSKVDIEILDMIKFVRE